MGAPKQSATLPDVLERLPLTAASWRKNDRELVRVRLDHFNHNATVDVRIWYGEPDDLKPGRSGITLGIKHLPALADAVAEALAFARELGLVEATPE